MKNALVPFALLLYSTSTAAAAAASPQYGFSVNEDLLAFPQFNVHFLEEWLSPSEANARSERKSEDADKADGGPRGDVDPFSPTHQSSADKQLSLEYETMMLDGHEYLCTIPQVDQSLGAGEANKTVSKTDRDKELARATARGWQLLDDMQGDCIYFLAGWWSYKFCYGNSVRQFHQMPPSKGIPSFPPVEDPTVEGYDLGSYSRAVAPSDGRRPGFPGAIDAGLEATTEPLPTHSELVQRGDSRYLVQRLEGRDDV